MAGPHAPIHEQLGLQQLGDQIELYESLLFNAGRVRDATQLLVEVRRSIGTRELIRDLEPLLLWPLVPLRRPAPSGT